MSVIGSRKSHPVQSAELQVPEHDVTAHWHDACFNHLFANQIGLARTALRSRRLRVPRGGAGHGERRMGEAARLLMLSEAGARKAAADAVVLPGLTSWNPIPVHVRPQRRALKVHQALPHRLPHDLEHPSISATATSPSRTHRTCTSVSGLSAAGLPISSSSGSSSLAYASANMSTATFAAPAHAPAPVASRSIFGRWGASTSSSSASLAPSPTQEEVERHEKVRSAEGAVEEMIAVGMAFGFVLFNLVFSLLLKKAQSLVGLLGFKHDRCAAGVGGLDPAHVGRCTWCDRGTAARAPQTFVQVDTLVRICRRTSDLFFMFPSRTLVALPYTLRLCSLYTLYVHSYQLVFELAWILLGQRGHQEAADAAGLDKKEWALVLAGADLDAA
ncbi:hypothetical protein C8R44DRAFT_888685 [Mycena epipterygia]|nr:hypothetical protein C8R44DRAFT_888685 [Mycena epipterygia]